MNERPEVLVVGEAWIDVHDDGMTIRERLGGSAGNVAVGLARLGRNALLHTSIGRDVRGREITAYLRASGVALSRSSVTSASSAEAHAVLRRDGSASYDYRISWEPEPDPGTPPARCVHVGSVAAHLEPGATTVLGLVAGLVGRSLVTFNAKIEPSLVGSRERARARTLQFVDLAAIVKVSERDLLFLYPQEDPLEVLHGWVARGPDLVVLTRGPRGATAVTSRGVVDVPAIPVLHPEEDAGAGDAFMSALIDGALTLGADADMRWVRSGAPVIEPLLARAVRSAAITVARAGAVPPTAAELARSSELA